MNRALLLAPCLLLPLVLSGLSTTAAVEDFALLYTIDDATGDVQYQVFGTYSAAIHCLVAWQTEILTPVVRVPETLEDGTLSTSSSSSHTIRYGVSLALGTLRVTETKDGQTIGDVRYTCGAASLDTSAGSGASLGQSNGMEGGVVRVPSASVDCDSEPSGVHARAPTKHAFTNQTPLHANDDGICLDLYYSGPLYSAEHCSALESGCVPFSGNFVVRLTAATTTQVVVDVLARACSFLVVGGLCWGEDGNTEPVLVGTAVWPNPPERPCTCQADHRVQVYVTEEDIDRSILPTGAWESWVRRQL